MAPAASMRFRPYHYSSSSSSATWHRSSPAVVAGVMVFAVINGTFEETLWRGVMAHLPAPDWIRILYPAAVFAFMHWFNFAAHLPLTPMHVKVLLVATFLL